MSATNNPGFQPASSPRTNGELFLFIGENVGSEIDGKNLLFSRPVIIYKKLAHGFYFVIPTTTKSRAGSWYINFKQQDKEMTACLHQVRAIDHRRLSSKIGTLDDADFSRVKDGFNKLYK